jgi:hypothetical protein
MPATTLRNDLVNRILRVTEDSFDELSMAIFRFQFTHNLLYREYCKLLGKDTGNVSVPEEAPFLPISFFKTHDIHTNAWNPRVVFTSSGTSGQTRSRHLIRDLRFYHENCIRGFASVFGHAVSEYVWLALLPSQVDRPDSSLISMVSAFIEAGKPGSRFITRDEFQETALQADLGSYPVVCISLSFTLLDLTESLHMQLSNTVLIETGGMKGRRSEPTRKALHRAIQHSFGVPAVCSEYGMTELLSQAWSKGEGIFRPAPGLRILIRDFADPLTLLPHGSRGGINCIDLANLDTCAFIATDDVGIVHPDGSFEALGRFDASEWRGCNLMVGEMRE